MPTVPLHLFREQLTALGEIGRIVPLDRLLNEPDHGDDPLRFALTFDDDYNTHHRYVLPVLREFGLQATFFLSGRTLHGLGAYWFEQLEALVKERGVQATAELLNLRGVEEEAQLPLACEGDLARQKIIEGCAPPCGESVTADQIRELAAAGMTIGFHTLHHPVLPTLDDNAIRRALSDGRHALGACVAQRISWFAYPHGKADERTVRLTQEAGYTAAWTTQPRLLRVDDDPYCHGRWEPLPMSTAEMLIRLGAFLRRVKHS